MKYCPEITQQFADLFKDGSNRTDACLIVGISYDTFCQWMKKPEFSEAIKKAEAVCKNRNINIIQKAAITTWQAAAWWLERKHQNEFAIRNRETNEEREIPIRMAERAAELLKKVESARANTDSKTVHS